MSMVSEFKEFAVKGNVLDLAVGVILGAAFGKVVDSLVNDLIMAPVGAVTGKGFVDSFVVLKAAPSGASTFDSLEAARKAGAVVFAYGNFVTTVFNFLIIAFAVFMLVKLANRWKKPEAVAEAVPTPSEVLLAEIRDELRKK